MGEIAVNIGEVWVAIVAIPYEDENGDLNYKVVKRPILIVDDGRGLIITQEALIDNVLGLKLTTQGETTKTVDITNWKEIGLHKPSSVRIEIPQKIEKEQLVHKVADLSDHHDLLKQIFTQLFSIFNVEAIHQFLSNEKEDDSELVSA